MNASYLTSAVPALLELATFVVGIVLVSSRTVGTRRRLGVIGLVVGAVLVVLRSTWVLAFPLFYRSFGASAVTFGLLSGLLSLIWIAALGLLIAALVTRDRPAPTYPTPSYPQDPTPR